MTKKCLDCTKNVIENESDMERSIPLWYKKIGNYSLLPKALNCNDKYNPQKNELKTKKPTITDIEVKVDIDIKEKEKRWVFYWAAMPNKDKIKKIKSPEKAYQNEQNSGLVQTDDEGKATLILNCPQPYKVDGITYPRHVHYTTTTDENVWSEDVRTITVYCHLDKDTFKEYLENKTHIVINALPKKSHNKKSIPGTLNLPVDSLKKKSQVKKLILQHINDYPKLKNIFKGKNIRNIPIITYCAHSKCNASTNLANKLMDFKYINVIEYPGGIKEWFDQPTKESSVSIEEDLDSLFKKDLKKDNENLKIKSEIIIYECILW